MQHRCTLCQFVYDSEEGALEAAIAKGTEFADLPEQWVCPGCGATKELFKPIPG